MLMENYEEQEFEKGIDSYHNVQKTAENQMHRVTETAVQKTAEQLISKKKQREQRQNTEDIADIKEKACLQSRSPNYHNNEFFSEAIDKTKKSGISEMQTASSIRTNYIGRESRMFGEKAVQETTNGVAKETAKEATKGTTKAGVSTSTATAGGAAGTAAAPIVGTVIGYAAGKAVGDKMDEKSQDVDDAKRMAKMARENYMKQERIKMTYEQDALKETGNMAKLTQRIVKKISSAFVNVAMSMGVIFPIVAFLLIIILVIILIAVLLCTIIGGSITDNELDAGSYLDDMVYYSQLDPEWCTYAYGNGTIGTSGCGITCMAMCVATFADTSVTPPDMSDLSMENGGYVSGQGSAMSVVVTVAAKQYDLKYKSISANEIEQYIKRYDAMVIWGCKKGTFSSSNAGHVMIIRDALDGRYLLADPAHEERNEIEYTLTDITSQAKGYYYAVWSDEGRLTSDMENRETATELRKQIVTYAKKFKGNPYVYGGTSLTKGTDCSGFTMSVYKHFKITLPRTAAQQYQKSKHITKKELKPGDLCFYKDGNGNISHVSMYIGNNKVIHASNPESGIIISNMNYREAACYGSYIDDSINKYSEEDLLYLSAVMDAESSGYKANVAVGYCVLNRKKSKSFPNTIKGVVTQSGQFTSDWGSRVSGKKKISSTAKKAAKAVLLGSADNPIGARVYFRNIATYEKNAKKSGWHAPVYIYQAYDTNKTQGNVFFKEKNEK
jgi:spore germination cell wall hydrolase CwlJ-like protein/galactitol-specific phosphotransferase system IIB component/uncharacterized protein (DUF697 family)